jgi:hypothetical protein
MARHFGSADWPSDTPCKGLKVRHTVTQIINNGFCHHFCLSIRAIGAQSRRLWNRDDGWCAVDCGGGRIYNSSAVVVRHYLEKRERSGNIISVIDQGNFSRFSYGFVRLKECVQVNSTKRSRSNIPRCVSHPIYRLCHTSRRQF